MLNEHEQVLVVQEAHGPLRGKVSSKPDLCWHHVGEPSGTAKLSLPCETSMGALHT